MFSKSGDSFLFCSSGMLEITNDQQLTTYDKSVVCWPFVVGCELLVSFVFFDQLRIVKIVEKLDELIVLERYGA